VEAADHRSRGARKPPPEAAELIYELHLRSLQRTGRELLAQMSLEAFE
jgi:hypothetical protein